MDSMTWGEFKKLVEDAGVKDDSTIEWIDTGTYPYPFEIEALYNQAENEFHVH